MSATGTLCVIVENEFGWRVSTTPAGGVIAVPALTEKRKRLSLAPAVQALLVNVRTTTA